MEANKVLMNIICSHCKKTYSLEVFKSDLNDYINNGKLVQLAFPYLSAGERELIISGICDTCFNNIFDDNEEPEENMPESYEYNNRD